MNAETQRELDDVIRRVRGLYPALQKDVKKDLNEAATLIVAALKGRTPRSAKAHSGNGNIKDARRKQANVVQPGNLQKSMRRLPLRRTKNAAIVGPKFGGANDGFYAPFLDKGTKFIKAQHFIDKAAEAAGPAAQSIAIKLLIRRITDYEAANFK